MRIVEVVSNHLGYFAVSTNRRRNSVRDLFRGTEIANWPGKEVTAACCVNDEIVCAALDGRFYIIRNGDVATLKHKESGVWWYAGAPLDNGRCIFGGDLGRLMTFDTKTSELHFNALKEYDIEKPGRDILCIQNQENELFLLGKKELLVKYSDGAITSCLGSPRSETFFRSAAFLPGSLWIASSLGADNVLAEYTLSSGKLVYHPLQLFPALQRPAILAWKSQLYLATKEIYRGLPGTWQKVGEFNEEPIARLLPLANQPDSILAVGHSGKTKIIRSR